jgi:purine-nucleoside phosphorylase
VLVAVDFEARGLARRLPPFAGGGGNPELVIRTVGLGAADLPGLEPALAALGPRAIVVTGLAGGCAPDVRPGELLVANLVGPTRRGKWLEPDARLSKRARAAIRAAALPHRVGRLLTVPAVVATPEAKAALWERERALGVDMESAHVLDWAERMGVPAVVVRAVADGPRDPVPAVLVRAASPRGRPRLRILATWLAKPGLWRAAWRLRRRAGLALARLARFLVVFAGCQP